MKVSLITVVYNNRKMIKDAIESVFSQTYKNIEYIIIDGASTDGTVEIIQSYGKRIHTFISEKDNGLYDAMNKGMKLATGEVIGILNSDDYFANVNVISSIVNTFKIHNVDSCHGDELVINKENKILRDCTSLDDTINLFKKGRHPHHGTFFVKNSIYKKYGYFDISFKIAADYDLMLRFLIKNKISTYYIKEVLVIMRAGGESQKSIGNILRANYECYLAWRKYGLRQNILFIAKKPLSKLHEIKSQNIKIKHNIYIKENKVICK